MVNLDRDMKQTAGSVAGTRKKKMAIRGRETRQKSHLLSFKRKFRPAFRKGIYMRRQIQENIFIQSHATDLFFNTSVMEDWHMGTTRQAVSCTSHL